VSRRLVTSAPGKLMISGEYVVLDGAVALVAAVGQRLVVTATEAPSGGSNERPDAIESGRLGDGSPSRAGGSPDGASLPPEALLARQHAEAALGDVPMDLSVDASALRRGDRKLGLGSSSAASAAAAAAVVAWHGEDPADRRRDILGWALAGHRAIAPQGSGADVAAATLGGVVRFTRDRAEAAEAVQWPHDLFVEVVWTGKPARTSDLVAQVRALEVDDPSRYRAAMGALRDAADGLRGAIEAADAAAAVEAADAHGRAMGALGDAAGAPIVTEELARTAALARAHGGGSKPSGAGGGDVALAFFDREEGAAGFRSACSDAGLPVLCIELGAEGVRSEES